MATKHLWKDISHYEADAISDWSVLRPWIGSNMNEQARDGYAGPTHAEKQILPSRATNSLWRCVSVLAKTDFN
jgi:hypothetical protein